ncbi:haloacid dehalogenase type II [Phaeospirillum tilakii]|uniref:(S)-2-haloacid dehalogenase n=1 Tax=Phaeospirillum tilakii TaxID=741673 RepID=A0ABW5C9B2_9PROT
MTPPAAAANPFSGVRVWVFDAFGTLLDVGDLVAAARPRLGDRAGALGELVRRKQLEYSWLRSLMGRHADFLQLTADALDYALEAFGCADDPALRAALLEAWRHPRPYPDAVALLGRLRAAGRATAILSNGPPAMLTGAIASAGLGDSLDAVLSVESVGRYKPHPDVYALAPAHFGLAPAAIGFVSGNGWDAAGAAAFGFRVAWVNRAGAPRERLPAGPAATVASLAEIATLAGV